MGLRPNWNGGILENWVLASGSWSLLLGKDTAILGKWSAEDGMN